MSTRNHGNRLLLVNEQNDFFLFSHEKCLRFQNIVNQKPFLKLKKPISANFSSK